MTLYNGGANKHVPTPELRQRVCDLVMCGTPHHLICEVIEINDDTLRKYYDKELKTAKTIAIERIGKTVYQQALEGSEKSQALYLKTQGASQGWIEKQIVETTSSEDSQALRDKIKELEDKYARDY
jgi:hypothetical protein